MSRAYRIEMRRYTAETKPERDFFANEGTEELDTVYAYIRHWSAKVKLNLKPTMPPGVITRHADNARGLIAVADACGPEWGRRARVAVAFFVAKDKTERPWITIIRHGLIIFDMLRSTQFNKELRRLDLPDAKWTKYRGVSGTASHPHPLEMHEQAWLLGKVDIHPTRPSRGGERFRGYDRAMFEEALRKHGSATDNAEAAQRRLRLITAPSSN